jgi:hypothetical protein
MPKNNYNEFALAQEKIEAAGFKVVQPHELLQDVEINDRTLKLRVSALSVCDKVVTLPEWEADHDSKREVQIARIMDMPVENILTFLKTDHGSITTAI